MENDNKGELYYEKEAWPELMGENVDVAIQKIYKERPEFNIITLPNDTIIKMTDIVPKRVIIFYYDNYRVSRVPKCG